MPRDRHDRTTIDLLIHWFYCNNNNKSLCWEFWWIEGFKQMIDGRRNSKVYPFRLESVSVIIEIMKWIYLKRIIYTNEVRYVLLLFSLTILRSLAPWLHWKWLWGQAVRENVTAQTDDHRPQTDWKTTWKLIRANQF